MRRLHLFWFGTIKLRNRIVIIPTWQYIQAKLQYHNITSRGIIWFSIGIGGYFMKEAPDPRTVKGWSVHVTDCDSDKRMFCSSWRRASACAVNAAGPSVLPVRKLNSHESERKEEWLSLDSVTDIPPDCLVDSLDDAGSGIVLLYFQEVEHWGCLKITKRTIIVLPVMETVKTHTDSSQPVCIAHQKRETSGAYFQMRLI